ncbi:1-acyl-sn-glycerol-3-phosphate acyltransferase [Herbaspirillum sp. HC18]|nr:1-acyl-sn-glycerol-3-phosphate acyltransferase [Herbaspirillum sp. HC18]
MTALFRAQRDSLLGLQKLVVGGKAFFDEVPAGQCIFFSNHTSHLDTTGLLASLPTGIRNLTRPVAGADYWGASSLRRYIANRLLNVVMIDRNNGGPDALVSLSTALDQGDSLIVFPEGTRLQSDLPGPFKSGLYYLTKDRPSLALVPVYQENLYRALPKGAPFPLPLLCRSHFGKPIFNNLGEDKRSFLQRAHAAVCKLASNF